MEKTYLIGDDTTIHVYEGMKLMDIYDKDNKAPKFISGFDRLDNNIGVPSDIEEDLQRTKSMFDTSDILMEGVTRRLNRLNKAHEEYLKEINELVPEDDVEFKKDWLEEQLARTEDAIRHTLKIGSEVHGELSECTGLISEDYIQNEKDFREITEEMVTLYSKKNADYGDSFKESLDEDGLLVSKIRLKDKLKRFAQLIENDALVNDESMRDTLIDMANYTVMTLMWIDENE